VVELRAALQQADEEAARAKQEAQALRERLGKATEQIETLEEAVRASAQRSSMPNCGREGEIIHL
jgi:predicted  nucleic acid-binding Zn-ribbon protein